MSKYGFLLVQIYFRSKVCLKVHKCPNTSTRKTRFHKWQGLREKQELALCLSPISDPSLSSLAGFPLVLASWCQSYIITLGLNSVRSFSSSPQSPTRNFLCDSYFKLIGPGFSLSQAIQVFGHRSFDEFSLCQGEDWVCGSVTK